jgi:phenylacetate-CoA ligase
MSLIQTGTYLNAIRRESLLTHSNPKVWSRVQRDRLERLLEIAKSKSPFYAERLNGIQPSNPSLLDIPPVTKTELLDRIDEVLTNGSIRLADVFEFMGDPSNVGKWFDGDLCVYQTSGTQGRSLPVIQDRKTMLTVFSVMAARSAGNRTPSLLEGIKRLVIPKRVAVVTFKAGFYPSRAALSLLPKMAGHVLNMKHFSSTQDNLLESLADFKPHAIFGYASVLNSLAQRANFYKWSSLEHLSNSSEQLTIPIRKAVENSFGVPVTDHYGTGECLQLADTCTFGQMHVNSDWVILEPVDQNLKTVPFGVPSDKVLITNLANSLQPFIRYVVDDQVVIEDGSNCPCGCTFPIIKRFHGRSSDQITVAEEGKKEILLTGVLFHSAFDAIPECVEWRIVQTSLDSLTVEVILNEDHLKSEATHLTPIQKITEQLRAAGIPAFVQLNIKFCSNIPTEPKSGKLRRFVPLTKPAVC